MKACSKCKTVKTLAEFHRSNSSKDGHRSECKSCKALTAKAYNSTEAGRVVSRRSAHKYAQTANGKIARKAAVARYQKTARGREHKNAAAKKSSFKRYHLDPQYHIRKVWLRKHGLDDYRLDTKCAICSTTEDLSLDHKHPVSLGGTSDDSNLWTLCRSCNSFKGVRLMTEGLAVMVGDTIHG